MTVLRIASVWLLGVAPMVSAQPAADQSTQSATGSTVPSVAEVFAARRDLHTFVQSLGDIDAVSDRSEWSARVASARQGLEPISELVAQDGLGTLSLAALLDLERQVRGELDSLDELGTMLSARARARDRQLDELSTWRQRWRALANAAGARDAPREVFALLDGTEPEIVATAAALNDDRNAALQALSALTTLQLDATTFGSEIRNRRQQLQDISRRAAGLPIWSADLFPTAAVRSDALTTISSYATAVLLYMSAQWPAVLGWLLGLSAAAYWLLRLTGARVQTFLQRQSHTMLALAVFERPNSAALLIGLLGMLAFIPPAPVMFTNLTLALLPFPAAALAATVFAKQLRLSVYTLAIALSTLALSPFFAALPIVSRMVFLVQTLLVATAFYVDLRRGRWSQAFPMVRESRLSAIVRGACIVLLFILFADVIGFLGAADTLRTLVLGGLGLALVFTAIGHVLAGLALALLQVRPFAKMNIVRYRPWTIVTFVRWVIRAAAAIAWVVSTLSLSGLWTPLASGALTVLGAQLTLGEVGVRVSDLVAGIAVLWASWLISRFIRFVVQCQPLDGPHMAHGVSFAVSALLRYAISAVAFVLALAIMGFDLTRVTVLAGALGVGIGFGLQNIVNNFISGIILLFERPIQVNDIAKVDDLMGTVKEVGVRSTVIRTFDGAEVIVPNADFISKVVVNWTKSDRRRRAEIDVGVAYGTDPDRVIEILETAARSREEVVADPQAFAVFTGFGDSSLNFRLYLWLADLSNMLLTPSAIRAQILRALNEAGIEIPFPQRDVRVTVAPAANRTQEATRGPLPPTAEPLPTHSEP